MAESIGSIDLARAIKAPVHDVFRAWTEPALLAQWLATRAEADPQVGGRYRLESDGGEEMPGVHVCSGEYLEIVLDERIVKTWVYEGPDPADTGETIVTVRFFPIDDGRSTEMQFREEAQGLGTDEDREFSRQAWTTAFDELDRILSTAADA